MIESTTIYLTAGLVVAAFAGSWHCGLMCGPIACGFLRIGNIRYYHFGRLITYVGGGVFFGYLGRTLFVVDSLGAKLAVAVLLSLFFILPRSSSHLIERFVHPALYRLLRLNNSLFVFGLLSALLPCGWLWTFYAGAAASGSPWTGGLVTFTLWASSLPALSVLPLFFKTNLKQVNARRARIAHTVLSIAGIYAVWSHLFL